MTLIEIEVLYVSSKPGTRYDITSLNWAYIVEPMYHDYVSDWRIEAKGVKPSTELGVTHADDKGVKPSTPRIRCDACIRHQLLSLYMWYIIKASVQFPSTLVACPPTTRLFLHSCATVVASELLRLSPAFYDSTISKEHCTKYLPRYPTASKPYHRLLIHESKGQKVWIDVLGLEGL